MSQYLRCDHASAREGAEQRGWANTRLGPWAGTPAHQDGRATREQAGRNQDALIHLWTWTWGLSDFSGKLGLGCVSAWLWGSAPPWPAPSSAAPQKGPATLTALPDGRLAARALPGILPFDLQTPKTFKTSRRKMVAEAPFTAKFALQDAHYNLLGWGL